MSENRETHPKGLGVEEETVGQAEVAGVRKNLSEMGAKLGKVASNKAFLFDSAQSAPAGVDEAEPAPFTNYAKDEVEHGEDEE